MYVGNACQDIIPHRRYFNSSQPPTESSEWLSMGFKTLHPLIQVFPLSHFLQLHSNFFSHIKLESSPEQTTLSHLHAFEMLFSFPLPYLVNFQSTNSSTDNSITLFSSSPALHSHLLPSTWVDASLSQSIWYMPLLRSSFHYRVNWYLVECWKVVNSLTAWHMNLCILICTGQCLIESRQYAMDPGDQEGSRIVQREFGSLAKGQVWDK